MLLGSRLQGPGGKGGWPLQKKRQNEQSVQQSRIWVFTQDKREQDLRETGAVPGSQQH